jgi:CAAX protease family protein
MPNASGLQIAFLVIAFEFFSMLASKSLAPLVNWPAGQFELLGQLVSLSMAALLLFGHPGLRQYCVTELRPRIPAGKWPELIAATSINLSVPFAVIGAIVMHAFLSGSAGNLPSQTPSVDAATAWAFTLSPPGLFRMLVLSWFAGPVIEELVFRGLLYRAFERQWGWPGSLAVTSVLFGLFHPTHMVATALGSVVLICVLRRTGSLRACIFVHMAFNVVISWPLLGRILLTEPGGSPASLSTWTLPLACLAFVSIALPAYLWLARRDVGVDDAPPPAR